MRNFSRLFDLSDMQRRKQPFGASGPQDMFAGSGQHAQAVAAQQQEPSTAEQIIGGATKLASAGIANMEAAPSSAVAATAGGDFASVGDFASAETATSAAEVAKKAGFMDKLGGLFKFGGFRAMGGPVDPRKQYMVGERGPELFIPSTGPTFHSPFAPVDVMQGSISDDRYERVKDNPGYHIPSPDVPEGPGSHEFEDPRVKEWFEEQRRIGPPTKLPSPKPFGGARRWGGPVDPREQYLIGENGPEMFVPDQPGTVVPLNDPMHPGADPRGKYGAMPPTTPPFAPRDEAAALGSVTKISHDPRAPRMRIDPNQGSPAPRISPTTDQLYPERDEPPMTAREIALQDIQDAQARGPQRESKLWKRVGQGVLGGLREWAAAGQPGGIEGALGAVAGGAVMYGASKGTAAEMEHRAKLQNLFGKYKEAVAPEMAELERQTAIAKGQGEVLNNRKKQVEIALSRNSVLIDQLKAGKMTPKEVADYLKSQGIPAIEQDIREFKVIYDSRGQAHTVNTQGPPQVTPAPQFPIDPDSKRFPVTVKSPGGGAITGEVDGKTAVNAAVQAGVTQTRMQETKAHRDQQQKNWESTNQRMMERLNLDREKHKLNLQKEARIIETAKQKLAGTDDKTLTKRQTDLDKARQTIDAIENEFNSLGNVTRNPIDPDYNEETETTRSKRQQELVKKYQRARAVYDAILSRIQRGN
jgi:hypothetical protein